MKKIYLLICLFVCTSVLFSAVIITRNEMDIITKEMYHDNYFAEIHNDRIVSLWNFNDFELTLVNHAMQVYTTIDFEAFKATMQRQNQAQIDSELRGMGEDQKKLIADATMALFGRMQPRFMLADTLSVHGYKTFEFHVYNGSIIAQKLWVSKELQEKINEEVHYESMELAESILKENRQKYLAAIGIELDPVSVLVEDLEQMGYIVKRIDYGLRDKADPEKEKEIESLVNEISEIVISNVDTAIFTQHLNYRQLSYNNYQMMMIREAERLMDEE